VRQSSYTDDLIFSISKLIATLSQGMTLIPGDIILTGTPSGVGMGFDPPRYLKDGDVVTCRIEGIGDLTNKVVTKN
jgi:2-keto-4-pentenoate hydratase/2-oxohepta-3-ene-1,7-dioic acid hydratase in catechol pathway